MAYYNGKKVIAVNVVASNYIQGVSQNGSNLTISGSNINFISLQTPLEISLEEDLTIDELAGGIIIRPNVFEFTNEGLNIIGNTTINYTSGNVTATNLTPENIKAGVTILGVTGTYNG